MTMEQISELFNKCISPIIYGLIGILNTGIHFIIFISTYELIGIQSVANFIAFCIAVIFSFFMNSKFTFKKNPTLKMFIKMFLVMSLLSIGSGYAGDIFTIHPMITFIGYCIFSYLLGFILSKTFVYRD